MPFKYIIVAASADAAMWVARNQKLKRAEWRYARDAQSVEGCADKIVLVCPGAYLHKDHQAIEATLRAAQISGHNITFKFLN